MATKSSVIVFYLRLSQNTHRWLRAASCITLGVVILAGVILTFFNIFQCLPVSQVFEPVGVCIPIIELYLASSPVNVLTDIAVLVLPIPVLTGMQMPLKQKIILVATFALGLFVVTTDIIRIFYLQQSSSGYWGVSNRITSPILGNELDFSWFASLSFLWSAIEVNVGLICASVPTLKPVVSKIWPTLIDNRRWSWGFLVPKRSTSSTTAVNSPTSSERKERVPSPLPIALPRQALASNTTTFRTARSQHSSFAAQTIRSLPPTTGEWGDVEMDMLEFVTSPGMDPQYIPRLSRATTRSQAEIYFGFLSIKQQRSMLRMGNKDSIKYCMLVSTLLFITGFSHGLWNNLNNQISKVSQNSIARSVALFSAYYAAYFIGPTTVGQLVMRKVSFKATIITGLCIYGTGTLMYWPSAVLLSFPGFVISSFFVGFGLSIVELAADTFITLCGPAYYREIRLLTGQSFESIGKVVGMLVAAKGLFQDIQTGPALLHMQWVYLGVALFAIAFAVVVHYLPIPEATDEEIQQEICDQSLPQLNRTINSVPEKEDTLFKIKTRFVTLVFGACAQFVSAGVLLAIGVGFSSALQTAPSSTSTISTFDFYITADASGAFGRIIFAGLCFFVKPRILLLISFSGAVVVSTLVFTFHGLQRNSLAVLLLSTYFFLGPLWPLIFSISLRRMGRQTKLAAAVLTSAQGGASLIPWMMYAIIRVDGKSPKFAYCLILSLLALGTMFPIYLSVVPSVRKQIDRREIRNMRERGEDCELPRSFWDSDCKNFKSPARHTAVVRSVDAILPSNGYT